MGGYGSGHYSHCGANKTTDDYHSLDVRRWQRDGLLIPSQSFVWQWLRDDKIVAAITAHSAPGKVTLMNRPGFVGGRFI